MLLVATAAAAIACESRGIRAAALDTLPDAGADGATPRVAILAFEPATPLTLAPGERRTLRVRVTPPSSVRVRFTLVGKPGVPKDASLDRGEEQTASDGSASVALSAPTSATLFTVRATLDDGTSAEQAVSVSGDGFTFVDVQPAYGGRRNVTSWVASLRQGARCSSFNESPPPDGDLVATAQNGQLLRIEGAPLGVDLALTVRAGYFASGCANIGRLSAEEPNLFDLAITDVPLQLAGSSTAFVLTIDTAPEIWAPVARQGFAAFVTAIDSGSASELAALLDAMRAELSASLSTSAFDAARDANRWDTKLGASFGGGISTPLTDAGSRWLDQALAAWTKDSAIRAALRVPSDVSLDAELDIDSIAGAGALTMGFRPSSAVVVVNQPGDTLLIGATQGPDRDLRLPWSPSRFAAALVERTGKAVTGESRLGDALAKALSCEAVAQALASTSGELFAGCDGACGQMLCRTALSRLVESARDASLRFAALGTLSISAVAQAEVDDHARPTRLAGTWVGVASAGLATAELHGAITAPETPTQ